MSVQAFQKAEHRPLMRDRHPEWAGRAEYWAVHDVDFAPPEAALPEIEGRVRELIARLAGRNGTD